MKKPGFPPSTIALVVIMLGALFMVSKSVTPPPASPPPVTPASAMEPAGTAAPTANPEHGQPGHDHSKHDQQKPTEPVAKPDPKKEKEQQDQMIKHYKEQMDKENKQREIEKKAQDEIRARMKLMPEASTKPLKYDPTNNNIDSKFFNEMPMGDTGIEATDKAVAQAEVIKAKMSKAEAIAKAQIAAEKKAEKPKQATP